MLETLVFMIQNAEARKVNVMNQVEVVLRNILCLFAFLALSQKWIPMGFVKAHTIFSTIVEAVANPVNVKKITQTKSYAIIL